MFRFEWVDGALTKAIEEGSWVVLDNANLCNPTVLDRLNPLLEPDGTLLLNEAGSQDGSQRILTAHPNFRLFLTMDPRWRFHVHSRTGTEQADILKTLHSFFLLECCSSDFLSFADIMIAFMLAMNGQRVILLSRLMPRRLRSGRVLSC